MKPGGIQDSERFIFIQFLIQICFTNASLRCFGQSVLAQLVSRLSVRTDWLVVLDTFRLVLVGSVQSQMDRFSTIQLARAGKRWSSLLGQPVRVVRADEAFWVCFPDMFILPGLVGQARRPVKPSQTKKDQPSYAGFLSWSELVRFTGIAGHAGESWSALLGSSWPGLLGQLVRFAGIAGQAGQSWSGLLGLLIITHRPQSMWMCPVILDRLVYVVSDSLLCLRFRLLHFSPVLQINSPSNSLNYCLEVPICRQVGPCWPPVWLCKPELFSTNQINQQCNQWMSIITTPACVYSSTSRQAASIIAGRGA